MQNENDKIEQAKAILEKVAKEYKQESFSYALNNCLHPYLNEIIHASMLEYAQLIASERCNELEEQIKAKDGLINAIHSVCNENNPSHDFILELINQTPPNK
jgi:hypothetical protein